MKLEQKIISQETVFEGKVFDIEKVRVKLPDGRCGTYDIVKTSDACAVVALDDMQNVIMVRQFRQSAEKVLLEIPAGKIDEGEEPKECAVRELQEETGYKAGNIEKILSIRVSPGYTTEVIHVYKATELAISDTNFDEDEFIETVKIPVDEVIEMIKKGEIEDGKTIAAIFAAI